MYNLCEDFNMGSLVLLRVQLFKVKLSSVPLPLQYKRQGFHGCVSDHWSFGDVLIALFMEFPCHLDQSGGMDILVRR